MKLTNTDIETFHGHIFFSTNKRGYCHPIIIFKCFLFFLFVSILVLKAGNIQFKVEPNKKLHLYFFWNMNKAEQPLPGMELQKKEGGGAY